MKIVEVIKTNDEYLITDKNLNKKYNNLTNNIYNITDYCNTDGITDITTELKALLDIMKDNDILYSPPNLTFCISSEVDISNINILFNNSKIKMLNANSKLIINDTTQNNFIEKIEIDMNNISSYGLVISKSIRRSYNDIYIINCTSNGIQINGGYENTFNNILVQGNINSAHAIGLDINTSDCHFTDIFIVNINTAIKIGQFFDYFTRVHAWCTFKEVLLDSTFMDIYQRYGTEIYLTDCYSDTYYRMFRITNTGSESSVGTFIRCTGCQTMYNETYYNNSLGLPSPIILDFTNEFDSNNVSFINCNFIGPQTYNNTTKIISAERFQGQYIGTRFIRHNLAPLTTKIIELHNAFTEISCKVRKINTTVFINAVYEYDSSMVNTATTVLGKLPYGFFIEGGQAYNGVCHISDDKYGDTKERKSYYLFIADNIQISIPKETGTKYLFINICFQLN